MTYWQNSFTMSGATSPVNAPFSSQCRFCAPRPIPDPARISAKAGIAMKGGHKTFSTFAISFSFACIVETSPRASATVLFIFQLPATSGVRILIYLLNTKGTKEHEGKPILTFVDFVSLVFEYFDSLLIHQ